MTDSPQLFGVALTAMWGVAGAVALGRAAAKSPASRELAAAFRKANFAAKCALVAGLVCAVAVGGTKPGGNQPRNTPNTRISSVSSVCSVVEPPPFAPVEVRTNNVAFRAESAAAIEVVDWRKHGSSSGGVWLDFEDPVFRIGTNPVSRAYVAANGVVSFVSMRCPPVGSLLPDNTGLPALAPLFAPLGMVPEANWTNAGAASRFWHAAAPGRGRVLTWEEALLDRLPGRRVSVQAELLPSGDFTYRYDFADALDPPATNLVIGAQAGTNGVNALAILGTNLLSESVWRVDGAYVTNGVSIADLLCTNGVLRAPARFAIEWKNTSGIDLSADTDGDGLSDWQEVFLHATDPAIPDTDGDGLSDASEVLSGADPLDADENDDGVPDGADPTAWTEDPLWGEAAGETNLVLRLDSSVPAGRSATLLLGNLAIPLRAARSWALHVPEGPVTPFELRTMNGATVSLSLSGPATGAPDPIHLDDPDGVFRVSPAVLLRSAPPHDPSSGGAGHLCVLDARFADCVTGEPAPVDECIHDASGVRRLTLQFSDPVHAGMMPTWSAPTMSDIPGWIELSVSDQPGDADTASATFASPQLVCGSKTLTASIHRCAGGHLVWCHACGMFHDASDPSACPHAEGCPAKTDPTAECTCPVPVIRVSGTGTPLSEFAGLDFPGEAYCCCSRPSLFTYARLTHVDSNLSIRDSVAPSNWVDAAQCPASATVYATAESGNAPSEIEYQIVRRRYDGNGGVATNEVVGTRTLRIWATTPLLEPITTARIGDRVVNPCGIVLDETATFRMEVSPAAFPDSLIEWTATPAGRVRFDGGVRTGRQVAVTGVSEGDVTLAVNVTGYAGPPPIVRARVMPRTTVPVYAWIVCGSSGVPAVEESVLRGKFPEINRIWDQAGITWQLAEVNFVTNQAWLRVSSGTNGNYREICNHGNSPGGVELYCVRETDGPLGMTSLLGSVVIGDEPASVYAHEFGHFCGLKDIYVSHVPETNLSVSGEAEQPRFSLDWPSSSPEGYLPAGTLQATLIPRLLMCGRSAAGQADISAGDVYGLWNNRHYDRTTGIWVPNYELGRAPIGFLEHGDKQPIGN